MTKDTTITREALAAMNHEEFSKVIEEDYASLTIEEMDLVDWELARRTGDGGWLNRVRHDEGRPQLLMRVK